MPIQLIQQYYSKVEQIIRYGGSRAEYKESVIELLERVCTVSVETMQIVKEMPK